MGDGRAKSLDGGYARCLSTFDSGRYFKPLESGQADTGDPYGSLAATGRFTITGFAALVHAGSTFDLASGLFYYEGNEVTGCISDTAPERRIHPAGPEQNDTFCLAPASKPIFELPGAFSSCLWGLDPSCWERPKRLFNTDSQVSDRSAIAVVPSITVQAVKPGEC